VARRIPAAWLHFGASRARDARNPAEVTTRQGFGILGARDRARWRAPLRGGRFALAERSSPRTGEACDCVGRDPHVGKRRRTRGRSITYALAAGIWRRRAAYCGTQDGTEHQIRHSRGTRFGRVGILCLVQSKTKGEHASLAEPERTNVCSVSQVMVTEDMQLKLRSSHVR
jgi:hypothetical protein